MILLISYKHFLSFFILLFRLKILNNEGIIDIAIGYDMEIIKLKVMLLIKSICEFLKIQQKQLMKYQENNKIQLPIIINKINFNFIQLYTFIDSLFPFWIPKYFNFKMSFCDKDNSLNKTLETILIPLEIIIWIIWWLILKYPPFLYL